MKYESRYGRSRYGGGGRYAARNVGVGRASQVRNLYPGTFDGANDWLSRDTALTGIASSKVGTLSVWLRVGGTDSTSMVLFRMVVGVSVAAFLFERTAGNRLRVIAKNAAGTNVLVHQNNSNILAGNPALVHFLLSYDLAATTSQIYINDATGGAASTANNDTIPFGDTDNSTIGSTVGGGNKYTGDIGELWFSPASYIDISVEANRRKFITAAGGPVDLGYAGQNPTGSAPLIYLSARGAPADNLASNRGPGGSYTVNGALALGAKF